MAYTITINQSQIKDKILRFSYPKANSVATEKARGIASQRKTKFLQEFDNHPVSQEIKSGAQKEGNVDGVRGNLFSFIGFEAGETPVEDLYYYFEQAINLVSRRGVYDNATRTFTYKMRGPTEQGILKVTDMSKYAISNNRTKFGAGLSWVAMIERGIPGLSQYKFSTDQEELRGKNPKKGASRSGTGLQRKNEIHPGASYQAREYLTELLQILAGNNI